MEELISVIVPIYKVEDYIQKCIDSIIKQTYNKLEIILVDDGSPDNCGKICDGYALKDKRIKVIHKTNGGLSDARNAGINIAKGQYITFVDSDDYIDSKMIETLYTCILKYQADISVIAFEKIDRERKTIKRNEDNYINVFSKIEGIKYLFYENSSIGNYAWNKMYKKELFNNIRYPENRKMEDLGTTYLLFDNAKKIVFKNEILYYYIQREDSILHCIDQKLENDKYDLSLERFIYLKNKYPELKENYLYMLKTLLECYPYIDNTLTQNECKNLYDFLSKQRHIYFQLNIKEKIKYNIFRFNKKMYVKLFKKE